MTPTTPPPARDGAMSERLVVENAAVATVDDAGTEYASGHVVAVDGWITAVGAGPAPRDDDDVPTRRVDGSGCLVTPGLVNTHHHLYQWVTRGLATDHTLFQWLTTLYPVWARLTPDDVHAAVRGGLGWLALSGCTTSTDHHYVFPRGAGDLLTTEIEAARGIGLRFDPCRGSMDLGTSDGGLPPDDIVEDVDTALAATAEAVERHHDPAPGAMTRIAVAPCSPFTVSAELLERSAELARSLGVRMHTHLAETRDEDEYCRERFGKDPVEYVESLGWLGDDVWLGHGVHLDDRAIDRIAETGTGVAHCPSSNARLGSGMAPLRRLLDAGVPVGLGVDGAASQEAGMLVAELRQALYTARSLGGPTALTAREALRLGTRGGAEVLGRSDELGTLEVGKLADLAVWRLDGLGHADIADPVTALVLGPPPPLRLLTVGARPVVEDGELLTANPTDLAREARAANRRLTTPNPGAPQ